MTIKLTKEKLSLAKEKRYGIVLQEIQDELFKESLPVIYVKTNYILTLINTTISIYDIDNILINKINMAGKTIIDVVMLLNEYGIESYLTKNTIAFLPAENILNFTNRSYEVSDIRRNPKHLNTIYGKGISQAPQVDKSYVDYKVISLYKKNTDIVYSNDQTSNNQYKYTIEDNKIYINRFTSELKCLVEFKLNTFFLFFQHSQVTETNALIKNDKHSDSSKILLNSINAINRDKI